MFYNIYYRIEKDRYVSDLTSTLSYESFSKADIVIEAVFENIKIKHQVIKELEQVVPKHCIIATNTSAIPIGKISEGSSRPENVSFFLNLTINCFWLYPFNISNKYTSNTSQSLFFVLGKIFYSILNSI